MAYQGNLLKIGNAVIPGLKEYDVQYAKLWKDAERNMNGNLSASLIGIFTKLKLTFAPGLSENQVSTIIQIFNQPYFNATYYDPETKTTKTEEFYASDFDVSLLFKGRGIFNETSLDLIATKKRS